MNSIHRYDNGAEFSRTCPKCKRFVKPYKRAAFNFGGQPVGNNAACKRHGRVAMNFLGYY